MMLGSVITNVYITERVTIVTLAGISSDTKVLAEVFGAIAEAGINIDMINQTQPYQNKMSISFTIADDDLAAILPIIGKCQKSFEGLRTDVNGSNCKVLLYGEKMVETPGVGAWAFSLLASKDIDVKLITTSDVDISIVIDQKDEEAASELFHAEIL